MAVKALHLRRGQGVRYQDQVWVVFSTSHVVKGKGQSYMQIELKNANTGQLIRNRFRVDEQLEEAFFERKKMEFLYADGTNLVLMDPNTYDQAEVPKELVGDKEVYLQPNMELEVSFAEGRPVSVELPNTVELTVIDTPPQLKGATATNQLKDADCEGGAKIKVPPFIENGTVVKIDTRTGEYLGRG
ncbi:MAG TPA: elongation factor P [Phycisphaerae bacterium]|nr:elongation factor P [Phycisphaerae bacterium]